MIDGSGQLFEYISKNIHKYNLDDNYYIYVEHEKRAQYVSTDFELICSTILKKSSTKTLIYISTTSILDSEEKETDYAQFNLKVEQFIQSNINEYLIIRLPIIIGLNMNGLIEYIYESLVTKKTINVHKNACRYIIDVDDILYYINTNKDKKNQIINFALCDSFTIIEIIDAFSEIIKMPYNFNLINKGTCFQVQPLTNLNPQEYLSQVLNKYYGQK